jgi:hypothetical protein
MKETQSKKSRTSTNSIKMKNKILETINKAHKSKECNHLKPEMKILFVLLWLYLKN